MTDRMPLRLATREDVQILVDRLIQRQQVKLARDVYDPSTDTWAEGASQERHTIPSLWEQLQSATSWKAGGPVTGQSFGSRPVIATGIVALRTEVELFAVKCADELSDNSPGMKLANLEAAVDRCHNAAGLRSAEYRMVLRYDLPDDMSDEDKVDYEAELRHAAAEAEVAVQDLAAAVDARDDAQDRLIPDCLRVVASNTKDQVDLNWWRENLRGWIGQIRSSLTLDPGHPQSVRGEKCPDCGADTAPGDQDGEAIRQPALAITWAEPARDHERDQGDLWTVRAIECRACGQTWWRGEALDSLALALLTTRTVTEKAPLVASTVSNMALWSASDLARPETG